MREQLDGEEILEGRGMQIRRDDTPPRRFRARKSKGRRARTAVPPHIHLLQEERFVVHIGELQIRRGRDQITVGPGEDIRIPPKIVHTFQAQTESTYTVEFRPALRIEEFFRDLFAPPPTGAATPESAMPPA